MISPDVSVGLIIDALHAQPSRSAGTGRAALIVAARGVEDAIRVAHAVAETATPRSVYAIDLDVRKNGLARSFITTDEPIGPRIDGALNGVCLWNAIDRAGRVVRGASPYGYHRVSRTHLFVGALNPRAVPRGGRVAIASSAAYWDAVRAGGATAVVCAPALAESEICLRIARHMDGVVLLIGSDAGSAPAALAAKHALDRAEANVIGLVYAGVTRPMMALERLRRRIG